MHSTKVFIHGNPETKHVWDLLIKELDLHRIKNIICLSPPGFGSDYPEGFIPNRRNYIDWLSFQLTSIKGPIDIVAHDWGAAHLFGLLAEQPNAVRSWIADSVGMLHPNYQWHQAAQTWQNKDYDTSLQSINNLLQLDPHSFAHVMSSMGMNKEIALLIKSNMPNIMAHSVVSLYTDAVQPQMKILGELLIKAKPSGGLVIGPEYDDYSGDLSTYKELADALGAQYSMIDNCGHWWMTQKPKESAQVLISYWSQNGYI